MRAREDRRERIPNATLETVLFRACIVEGHQSGEILVGGGTTERALGELRDDLGRAPPLFGAFGRLADEDLVAARRFTEPRNRQRAANLQRMRRLNALLAAFERDRARALVAFGKAAVDERHGEIVLPGRRVEADLAQAVVDG